MDSLPIWLSLKAKKAQIFGNGASAVSKATILNKAGADVVICAPYVSNDIALLIADGHASYRNCDYSNNTVFDSEIVFIATENAEYNSFLSNKAKKLGLLVNVVDCPSMSNFIMPAIIDRGSVVIGISTGGKAPVLAARIRAKIESLIPHQFSNLADFIDSFRLSVKKRIPSISSRNHFWKNVIDGNIGKAILRGDFIFAKNAMTLELKKEFHSNTTKKGSVALVGAGPGDPELLTVRALRLIQDADVIVYDRLVPEAIIDLSRRDSEKIYVGKKKSNHSVPQDEINEVLRNRASNGYNVVRLKGGDPFIFGRGGEETSELYESAIDFEIVPGISAALGCAAAAGIPLTHRDYADSVTFLTGHSKEEFSSLNFKRFALSKHTLVVYMGVGNSKLITNNLIKSGLSRNTPSAIIENGTTDCQRILFSDLENLDHLIKSNNIKSPALLIIGEVVALSHLKDQSISFDIAQAV